MPAKEARCGIFASSLESRPTPAAFPLLIKPYQCPNAAATNMEGLSHMTIRNRRASGSIRTAAALICGLLPAAAGIPATAQVTPTRPIGDWMMECAQPAGAQGEQCSLTQRVYASDRSNIGLDVIVFRTADRQSQLLRVFAPLGVLLPYGLGLRIDEISIGTTEFVRCFYPEGCMAEVIIDDILLGQLRAGTSAEFVIVTTPGEPIGVPISLQGFAEGFDALP